MNIGLSINSQRFVIRVASWCYCKLGGVGPKNSIFLHFGTAFSDMPSSPESYSNWGEYKVRGPDVKISKNGSMLLVEPISSRARQWLICNPRIERWPWRGSALMVEALVAPDLISAMADYGLRIFRYGVAATAPL